MPLAEVSLVFFLLVLLCMFFNLSFFLSFSLCFGLMPFVEVALCNFSTVVLLLIIVFSPATGDLNSDEQALLAFTNSIPHSRILNWNPATPIYTTWIGVKCSPNNTRVVALRLPGVGFSGHIPANTLGKLNDLRVVSLRSNRFNGPLPSDVPTIQSLNFLYLQKNNFSGDIPTCLPPHLNVVDLSFNSFTGTIPLGIQNLTQLTGLILQNNSLTGLIPDLNLPSLKHLNLCFYLNCTTPTSLQKFPCSSFVGNSLLRGFPLVQYSHVLPSPTAPFAPTQPQRRKRKLSTWAIIAIVIGGLIFLYLLSATLFVCCFCWFMNKNFGPPS